jgi:peptidoglycan/xylan/chitin deacetylase (PgdA/CDA1 family)
MNKKIDFLGIIETIFIVVLISAVGGVIFSEKINKNIIQLAAPQTALIFNSIVSSKEIVRGNTAKKEVIFTFDGGGTIQSADKILEALKKHHIKGTFFLTGKVIEAHPDLARRIVAEGHEIFSHTYDHADLTTVSGGEIVDELERTEKALLAAANVSPRPYFRAPYGSRNARVLSVAAKAGYQSVYWTIDALDWKESISQTPAEVEGLILSTVAPGNIYLMHLGDTITGAILDDVFTKIENKGYRIVSLTQGI